MKKVSARFQKIKNEIFLKYPDYHRSAYTFVYQSLEFACRNLSKFPRQHLSGTQLVQFGVVPLGLQQWGFLALPILQYWGIQQGSDIGEIVRRLVEFRVLQKDEKDDFEDFKQCNLQEMLTRPEKL